METLLGYAMMAVAVWAVFRKWQLGMQVKTAETWPTAEGTVISSTISSESSGGTNGPNTTYKARITYEYEAAGRTRRNNVICIGGQLQLSLRGKAENYCLRYPVGEKVTVHYNPKKPTDAVLEVREETSWFYLAGGAVMGVVGYFFASGSV